MGFVSVTRLRVRALRFLPRFGLHALRTNRQVAAAEGFLAGALLPDAKRTFWTMTLWRDRADMQRYIASGAHLAAMPHLMTWCDEASIVHWFQEDATMPDWTVADRRMRAEGRPSKVKHPTARHADLSYAPPRSSRTVPIRPAGSS